MFLSRSSLIKTVFIASVLLLIGAVLLIAAYFISKGDMDSAPTVTAGIVMICLSALSAVIGVYADGISKPFAEATRLVRKDLLPKQFIEIYKNAIKGDGYAVVRPRFDTLELLYTAYDLLDDKRGRAAAIVEMKTKLKPSYKPKTAVYAADAEYKNGNIEEGDRLLSYAEKHDASATVAAMADAVRKSSGAAAKGDAATEERYYTGLLSASGLFKADNAAQLIAHYRLYQICNESGRDDEAKEHLKYCAEYGGHTAISKAAKALL